MNESILNNYLQSYLKDLNTTLCLHISDLENHHVKLLSSLHRWANREDPDISAFLYAAMRLPDCIDQTAHIILATDETAFQKAGYSEVNNWKRVTSRARRRRYHFNQNGELAVFLTSITDLDDLIPSLCAFQIEWNKMHRLLSRSDLAKPLASGKIAASAYSRQIRMALGLNHPDWNILQKLWGDDWERKIAALAKASLSITIQRLPLYQHEFEASAQQWWQKVIEDLELSSEPDRPIYLVSSNEHGMANLVSGFALSHQHELLDFMREYNPQGLWEAWKNALRDSNTDRLNLLYYACRFYLEKYPERLAEREACELELGFIRCKPAQYPRIEAQKMEIKRLKHNRLDPRLKASPTLANSQACIINIEYPLGLAAQHLTTQAFLTFRNIRGIYILGKSAAAIGRLGDIMIPNQVYDSHTHSIFRFRNDMKIRHILPYLSQIGVFDEQKSITVRGTFLHNRHSTKALFHKDFTGIEMEAGPYLNSIYQQFAGKAPSLNATHEIVLPADFRFGLIHYTSDTPYNIRPSLLSKSLGLTGLEGAYSAVLGIFQRILNLAD
jgi:hypothetical protein